jgi:hypothetical protein
MLDMWKRDEELFDEEGCNLSTIYTKKMYPLTPRLVLNSNGGVFYI